MAEATQTLEIDVDELRRCRTAGEPLTILDVREPWELELCRFADSLNVPLAVLPDRLAAVPRDRTVVVVCHHGMRSWRAMMWLRAQGVTNAVNLRGGIDEWARRIDPAMRTY
jgi:rhodanese-related sulfurtransferase